MGQEVTPDIRLLKAQLRRSLLEVAIPEQKTHRDALLALEQKYAAGQDYAAAIRTRNERAKLEQEIASMEKELAALGTLSGSGLTSVPDRIDLKLKDATLTGLQLDARDGSLLGWDSPAAAAVWTLPNLPAGGYEVVLVHAGSGATASLKESFYTLSAPLKTTNGTPLQQTLGTLRIREGSSQLSLTMSPPEKGADLRVYSLVLLPAAAR